MGLKGGFQLMLIMDLLNMYFDAAVVFFTNSSLLFRLTVAIHTVTAEQLLSNCQATFEPEAPQQ